LLDSNSESQVIGRLCRLPPHPPVAPFFDLF
jgi:hypothetical protein